MGFPPAPLCPGNGNEVRMGVMYLSLVGSSGFNPRPSQTKLLYALLLVSILLMLIITRMVQLLVVLVIR